MTEPITHRSKQNSLIAFIFLLLAFPMFYFVYKFGTPYLGMIDFFDYYKLYENMDYKSADSPLNMRLVGSFFVYCMNKMGLFYDTATQIDNAPFEKRIYFNAVFFNYICVALTSTSIFAIARKLSHSVLMSFLGGLIYLLGFGTIFFGFMPLTDAFSMLLFSIAFGCYMQKSKLIHVLFLVMIFQREYFFFAFGLIALIDFIKVREKYYLQISASTILCFVLYFIIRKTVFETSRYAYQTDTQALLTGFMTLKFPLLPFIKQLAMTLNVFILYFGIVLYKKWKRISYHQQNFVKVNLLFLQLIVLSFLLGLGNNSGRYFYMLTPMFIIYLLNELKVFKLEA